MSKARDLADFGSNPDEQTSIITVTVAAVGGSNKFHLDGTSQQTITMAASGVYKFDQSHSSNANHPLKISLTSNGTHGGGSAITTDFVVVGTAGQAGAYVTYTIQQDGADNYFYYCANHSGMGGSIRKSGNPTAAEILTSIKTVDGTGSGLDADTLDGVEAAALLPLSGGTMTGNLALGDNVKAVFGAGSDLEIYSDGNNAIINEVSGTGSLLLQGQHVRIKTPNGAETMAEFLNDGAVKLYHNNVAKISTSAIGIDVNGTVQADQYNNDEALPDIRPSLLLDFANSKTLDPRITFTRGSTATFYDGVTTAKAEENLLKYSQELNNAAWGKSGTTATANNTAAPDGTTTAEKVAITTEGIFRNINQSPVGLASTAYTLSIFVKKSNHDYIGLAMQSRTSGLSFINTFGQRILNLTNGATIGTDVGTCTTTDVGNGWYRLTVSGTSASNAVRIYIDVQFTDSSGAANPSTNISNGQAIFLWGAQLEQRSAPTAYTPTTSAPIVKYQPTLQTAASGAARFDHAPLTGESKGLLIEEARTNLIPYSHDLTHSGWTKTRASITSNTIVGPDGTLTADKLVENTDNNSHLIMTDDYGAVSNGATYTGSVYAKAGERSVIRVAGANTNTWAAKTDFNLSNGTIINSHNGSATITDVGNGWFRCTITGVAGASATTNFVLNVMNSTTATSYTGNGFSGIYIWGAQVEAGSFPTSYIPTSGSTATRAADSASITGTNFSSFFNQNEGTVYLDYKTEQKTANFRVLSVSDNSTNNIMEFAIASGSGSGPYSFFVREGSNQVDSSAGYSYTANTNFKVATGYKTDDTSWSNNGETPVNDTSVLIPTVDRLYIGADGVGTSASKPCCSIRKLAYYPKRLSNATLQAMTTE